MSSTTPTSTNSQQNVKTYLGRNFNRSGRKGTLQLWQFLVALLDDPGNSNFITWTGRGLEFKLLAPEEVARRWGKMKVKINIYNLKFNIITFRIDRL